jgi:hypothetical protein
MTAEIRNGFLPKTECHLYTDLLGTCIWRDSVWSVWVEVIVVMTVQNTYVTPHNLQTFPRNELTVSSELKIALNIEAVRSFQTSVNFYKTTRVKSQNTFSYILGVGEQIA